MKKYITFIVVNKIFPTEIVKAEEMKSHCENEPLNLPSTNKRTNIEDAIWLYSSLHKTLWFITAYKL